ncbi:hypothetical protein V1478_003745, partial [Vespula squamosa]
TISLAEPRANSKAGSTSRDSSASSGHRAYLETRKLATHPRVRPNVFCGFRLERDASNYSLCTISRGLTFNAFQPLGPFASCETPSKAHARTRRSKILLIHRAEPAAAVGGGDGDGGDGDGDDGGSGSAWITQRRLLESPKESLIRGEYTAYAAAISRGAFNFVTHSTALSRKYIRHLKPALSAPRALIRLTASCSEMLLLV